MSKIKQIAKEKKIGKLSAALIDEFSEYTAQALIDAKLSQKDVLRFRISVETAMDTWLQKLGEGAECSFEVRRRFGRTSIAISCEGKKCNPQDETAEEFGMLENSSLLQSLGLSVGYSYEDGVNYIRFMPSTGFARRLIPIIISFALGLGLAFLLKAISPDTAKTVNSQVIDPIFSALMGLLRTIASPLIFLAVLSGICGIGDISTLGSIGKKLLGRFFLMTFVAAGVSLIIAVLLVKPDFGVYVAGTGAVGSMLDLVLQFIPSDIVSPFLNGNMLQVVTLSVACGLVMLILGERVSELRKIVDQMFSVVQLLMECIGKLVPIFIFFSMFSLALSDNGLKTADFLIPTLVIVGTFVVMNLIIYPIVIKLKYKVGFAKLMKKMLPTFLIAFTTASSAAAFSSNVETCENELGISRNMTRFGIPLGQVVYMPLVSAEYIAIVMTLAQSWNVQLSIAWIITAVIISVILAIATPPIPAGAISIFTVLFLQLNIPEAALPIALGLELIVDYFVTAGDVMCLQEEMIICADKVEMLDKETLNSK